MSGRVISGTAANCTRWSLSMVPLLMQLLRPLGTVTIRAGDKGYIFRVIRRPSPTRPETTSRGPTSVRPNELDHPNSPTPWHHHGTHTWWRPPPPRPLVRRRKPEAPRAAGARGARGALRQPPGRSLSAGSGGRRCAEPRAHAPTSKWSARERCWLVAKPVVRAANRRHGAPSA